MVGKHQAFEELVGLEFGFSFGEACFPGQFLYSLYIESVIKFFR